MPDFKAALTKAVDNEMKASTAHDAAVTALRTAQAAKSALIASAASGAAVKREDVRAADEAGRSAEIDAALAEQVHAGATKLRHLAQIDAWHGEAADLRAAIDAAGASLIGTAKEVDRAIEALSAAVDRRNAKAGDYNLALQAAVIFNDGRERRQAMNPVLAALDSGIERPLVPGLPHHHPGIGGQTPDIRAHSIAKPATGGVALADAAKVGVKLVPPASDAVTA